MLSCRTVIGCLLEYLEGTSTPEAELAVERHLQDCAACLLYLRTYRRTPQLVSQAGRVAMPTALKARVRQLLAKGLSARLS